MYSHFQQSRSRVVLAHNGELEARRVNSISTLFYFRITGNWPSLIQYHSLYVGFYVGKDSSTHIAIV